MKNVYVAMITSSSYDRVFFVFTKKPNQKQVVDRCFKEGSNVGFCGSTKEELSEDIDAGICSLTIEKCSFE